MSHAHASFLVGAPGCKSSFRLNTNTTFLLLGISVPLQLTVSQYVVKFEHVPHDSQSASNTLVSVPYRQCVSLVSHATYPLQASTTLFYSIWTTSNQRVFFVTVLTVSLLLFSRNRDMPPPGGFENVKYKRNLPFRGPSGAVVLAGVFGVCAFGFYKLGQGNLEKRCVAIFFQTLFQNSVLVSFSSLFCRRSIFFFFLLESLSSTGCHNIRHPPPRLSVNIHFLRLKLLDAARRIRINDDNGHLRSTWTRAERPDFFLGHSPSRSQE